VRPGVWELVPRCAGMANRLLGHLRRGCIRSDHVVVYFSDPEGHPEMMMPTPDAGGLLPSEEVGPSRTRLQVGTLRVRGFRALKDLCLDLVPRLTVLIGEHGQDVAS
jgi:hypothetical protein